MSKQRVLIPYKSIFREAETIELLQKELFNGGGKASYIATALPEQIKKGVELCGERDVHLALLKDSVDWEAIVIMSGQTGLKPTELLRQLIRVTFTAYLEGMME